MASYRTAEYGVRSAREYEPQRLQFEDSGPDWDQGWLAYSSLGGYVGLGATPAEIKNEENSWILDERQSESQRLGFSATVTGATHMRPQVVANSNRRDSSIGHSPTPYSHQQQSFSTSSQLPTPDALHSLSNPHSTLWWGDLEPWMDEEYAKQVCALMGWENNGQGVAPADGGGVAVKIPHSPPDATTGTQANNPGYCFLTFPNTQQAANVLARLKSDKLPTMPNSNRPFNLNWAAAPPPGSVVSAPPTSVATIQPTNNINPPARPASLAKEHSIFVGDLAPEASNSDLLAVFRNPILGLRSDRAPKCVRPFYSCKSAKIMLDPVTGVSKGYGFVRFTDQAEQQRALMEMHGLYCLSRPMRVSPATAKYKPPSPPMPPTIPTSNSSYMSSLPSLTLGSPPSVSSSDSQNTFNQTFDTTAPNISNKSVSQMLANGHQGNKSVNGNTSTGSVEQKHEAPFLAQLSTSASDAQPQASSLVTDDAAGWNSPANAQARAILASLTGPNGEQLSSADPYNTTVFVGGLSPLISEDTLRTFFAPFGDIHYVKVPVGKHCGFVQFVRKVDAQRAIDRMQGFPIGGSRIRLSWGRSQYKAAQAVVQQAQQQLIQQHPAAPMAPELTPQGSAVTAQLTPEQALQLLQQYGLNNLIPTTQNGAVPGSRHPAFSPTAESQNSQSFTVPQVDQGNANTPMNGFPAYGSTANRSPPAPYVRSAFSPFEQEHRHSMSDGSKQSSFVPPTFNRTPGFGPSPSLPANLKITPSSHLELEHARAVGNDVLPMQPSSAESQTGFNSGELGPYSQFFDGIGYRPNYVQMSDILRRDSQPLPRSSSNMSSRKSERDISTPSPASFLSASINAAAEIPENDHSDLSGTFKSLALDGKGARIVTRGAAIGADAEEDFSITS